LVRLLLDPILVNKIPYATVFFAVTISAVRYGWGPGVLSALAGAYAVLYLFLPPRHHPLSIRGADNQLGFGLYLSVSAMLILLAEMQRQATARAQTELESRERAEAGERHPLLLSPQWEVSTD
jgi:K+-sensing histidine kinase KdpD